MLHWQALPGLAKLPLFRSGTAGRQRIPFKPFKQFSGHNDSASMNIWLHKQVMTKLAANGGKLPPEIKH